MISLSTNSQPFYLKGEHLRPLRSTRSVTVLLIALLLVLVFSERCPADARYNYDTQNYDAQNDNSLRNLVRELTTSPFASQNTRYTDSLNRPTPAEYDTCQICCIVTVSKTYLRHALSLRLLLQNHSFALIANYSAPPNRALETHGLLTNYGMSQYRGYFAPGGVDPWGLFTDPDDVELSARAVAGFVHFAVNHPEIYDAYIAAYGSAGIERLAKAFEWGYDLDLTSGDVSFWKPDIWQITGGNSITVDTFFGGADNMASALNSALTEGMERTKCTWTENRYDDAKIRPFDDGSPSYANLTPSWIEGTTVAEQARNAENLILNLLRDTGDDFTESAVTNLAGGKITSVALGPIIASARRARWTQSVANSQVLARRLGIQRGSGLDAHHIVPGTHKRGAAARRLLDRYQIDITMRLMASV